MAIIVAFALFFLILFFFHKNAGAAHLAVIAGVSVYKILGTTFITFLAKFLPTIAIPILENLVYLTLVVILPFVLYLRSGSGGMRGVLRLVEAGIFAAVLTILIAGILAHFFAFDSTSVAFYNTIKHYEGTIVLTGVIMAYIDILLYKN